ncbi:MAG: tRNA modification GTPase [Gammaproteobacteria bacterium]|jgi:tRNA modification GTPase
MSDDHADTIAAIASGAGRAGIGIVRVSGNLVPQIARQICLESLTPRKAAFLQFVDKSNTTIDEGIALLFEAPHSFTGEHVLELQGHGGSVVLDLIMRRVLELGARPATPGEFSERAFLNDKLDLAQAEAISDLIDSSSVAAAQAAVRSMSGEFSLRVAKIQEELISIRVWLEAALDFSEEEIDFLAEPALRLRAAQLLTDFDDLLTKAEQGQRLRDGLTIVIAGVTNAGKSSLLNSLAGSETAIVTDIEGTTRDVLREQISIDGVPLHIVDTAGLRTTDDVVEQEGIRRAREQIKSADHVLVLIDAKDPVMPSLDIDDAIPRTIVINKSDTIDQTILDGVQLKFKGSISVSAKHGQGMDLLKAHLLRIAGHDSSVEGVFSARRRHLDALVNARHATDIAIQRLTDSTMPELAAEELRLAQKSLDQITGRFDSEDLLGRIFGSFCIGK